MDKKYYVEQLITGSFVKYNQLSPLIAKTYNGSSCTELNLFIDLNSLFRPLYTIDAWGYKYQSRYEIAATVLNMCGHYREFFRQLGVFTNIYMIYGLNCPSTNSTYVKGYNSKFMSSYIKKVDTTSLIEDNIKVLTILCQYIPKIYFFNIKNCEVSSMIDYIIGYFNASSKNVENLIISKDILPLQLVPEQNARILRPVKSKSIDESFIIDNTNLWYYFITSFRKGKAPEKQIPNTLFSNVLAMTRLPERSMFSVLSIPKVVNVLSMAIENNFLDPRVFYTQASINSVLSALDIKDCNLVELEMRYKCINTFYQSAYILPLECPETKKLRLIDIEDVQGLKEIITKYFDKVPIDLDRL